MRNDDIRRELNRELSGVHVSGDLRARILLSTTYSRKRGVGFTRGLAVAAAAVIILGIFIGASIAGRPEVPDRVLAQGSSVTPAVTAAHTPVPTSKPENTADIAIPGMWVYHDDGYFHLFEACAKMGGRDADNIGTGAEGGLIPCPECFADCVWIDNEGGYFHEDFDCPENVSPMPVNLSVLAHMDYESCPECVLGDAESSVGEELIALPTVEPTPPPEKSEAYDGPAVFYHDSNRNTDIKLTGWAAQNIAVNWALTPGGYGMVFTGSAVDTDKKGEISSPDTLENADLDYCWCTENGQYIHSAGNCSNMQNSFLALITPALKFSGNKEACPECGDGLGCVYYTKSGTYFHSDKTCGGMMNAESHTRRASYAAGKYPCPTCLEYESENPAE